MLNFTSGTTGNPKGVKVFHWALLLDSYAVLEEYRVTSEDTVISYLPSPHVFD